MSPEIESILKADKYGHTSYAYFCGEPEDKDDENKMSKFIIIYSCALAFMGLALCGLVVAEIIEAVFK